MKKIRAIRTVGTEPSARFVCIDDFANYNSHNPRYYAGVEVYSDWEHTGICPYANLRTSLECKEVVTWNDPIARNEEDEFTLPDITMYRVLSEVLLERGLIFNKKLGKIVRRKYVENEKHSED